MGDGWLSVLPWGILIGIVELLAMAFGYLYHKDRDERKLMFALAFALSGFSYVRDVQPAWASIEIVKRSYEWAFLPIASAVFITLLCSLLRLKDFGKPFKAFLLILVISMFMIIVPLPVAPDLFLLGDAICSIIISVYLIFIRKQIPELMFLLSIVCNILAGVGMAEGLAPEFNILGSSLAYVFIALVFAIPKEPVEGSVGSFFALKNELKNEKEKFERLFMNNPEPATYMDSNFHILDINPQFTKLFGFSSNEVRGKHIDAVIVPKDKIEEAKILQREFRKGYVSLDTTRKRKDGTLVSVSISGAPIIIDDQLVGSVGLYKDITERKQMEKKLEVYSRNLEELVKQRTQELKQSEQKLRNIVYGSPLPAFFIDKDHKVIYWNIALEKYSGLRAEEIIGTDQHWKAFYDKKRPCMADILVDGTVEQIPVLYSEKFKKSELVEGGWEATDSFILSGKKARWLHFTSVAVKDSKKNVIGALETLEDITELKETQQKLLKSERLAAIGELAGMVGHDLRNPLQAIQNAAYFLKTRFEGNSNDEATGADDTKKMINVVEKNVEYSNKIINDLLDYSREIRLELAQVTPQMIIQETLSTINIPEAVKVKNLVQDTPRIELDPVKIRRVFFNLVKNAIDAIPESGNLIISSNRADHHVDFVFTDTGTGMSQETMNRLWTPLFTTKARGMGFGLPICKRYVEAHGGKILVTSKAGEGTTFTVRLPIEKTTNQRENPSDHQ